MASQITLKASISFAVDSSKGSIDGSTPNPLYYDFTVPAKYHDERQTLSTAFAAINLGDMGWSAVTLACFKNHSSTPGENINILIIPAYTAGGTDDGTVAGASVPATLTGAGYYRRITSAGTSQSKTWAVGDYAIYLGSSGVYLQLRPERITLKPGETCAIRITASGLAWMANADSGTPQLGKVVVGACA